MTYSLTPRQTGILVSLSQTYLATYTFSLHIKFRRNCFLLKLSHGSDCAIFIGPRPLDKRQNLRAVHMRERERGIRSRNVYPDIVFGIPVRF